jgi:hypothetical protein
MMTTSFEFGSALTRNFIFPTWLMLTGKLTSVAIALEVMDMLIANKAIANAFLICFFISV